MIEEARLSDDDVCLSTHSTTDGKRGVQLSRDFSEEECVLILEDEVFEQHEVCEVRDRQTVRLFKEYQGMTMNALFSFKIKF